MRESPLIVTVKRHSLEDGPGIRSVVFFKGCPLRCVFCHNPEAQKPEQEISFTAADCLDRLPADLPSGGDPFARCGLCAEVCPQGAADLALPGRIERSRCSVCAECVRACPTGALRLIGTRYSVDELTELLLRDLPYYRHSRGGVTLSGGEPTLYPGFVSALLRELKKHAVHTCLETCGHFEYETFSRELLPDLDLVYFDLKLLDPAEHQRWTGNTNRRILDNLVRLHRSNSVQLEVRVPMVPGITAASENLGAIHHFLVETGIHRVVFLAYNPLGLATTVKLGRQPSCLPERFMTAVEEEQALSSFRSFVQKGA
jgi:pyruvate formate lyase activating enzyme